MSYADLLFSGGTTDAEAQPDLGLNFDQGIENQAEEFGVMPDMPPPLSLQIQNVSEPREKRRKPTHPAPAAATAFDGVGASFHCNYCGKDISQAVRIKCAKCLDFDLCINCFSVGAELHPHQNNHPYRVVEVLKFPVYSESWSADEEERLLEAMEIYGYGNWNNIADHLGTKPAIVAKAHYYQVYLDGSRRAPLPEVDRIVAVDEEWTDAQGVEGTGTPRGKRDITKEMNLARSQNDEEKMHDYGGFIPKREEFEYEWDNDCETAIGDMEFSADDTPEDVQLKLKVLAIYNYKLDERERRRKYILERGLLRRKKMNTKQNWSKEEKEIHKKVDIFSRFHTPKEHEAFCVGLREEQKLRKRLVQNQHYRSLGIRYVEEAEQYEYDFKRKNEEERARTYRSTHGFGRRKGHDEADEVVRRKVTVSPFELQMRAFRELLSKNELQLCKLLAIPPRQYMEVKGALMREGAGGPIKKGKARKLLTIDTAKGGKIFDFMVQSGWIEGEKPAKSRKPTIKVAAGSASATGAGNIAGIANRYSDGSGTGKKGKSAAGGVAMGRAPGANSRASGGKASGKSATGGARTSAAPRVSAKAGSKAGQGTARGGAGKVGGPRASAGGISKGSKKAQAAAAAQATAAALSAVARSSGSGSTGKARSKATKSRANSGSGRAGAVGSGRGGSAGRGGMLSRGAAVLGSPGVYPPPPPPPPAPPGYMYMH